MHTVLSRRDTLAMLTLALTLGPISARALVAPAAPASLVLPVSDLLQFDPAMHKDAEGADIFNLAFRVDKAEADATVDRLQAMQNRPLTEFTLNWTAPDAVYTLTMCSAYVHQYECAYLTRDGRGRNYEEFGLVVESTNGSLRRVKAGDPVTTAYSVSPKGAQWERRTA